MNRSAKIGAALGAGLLVVGVGFGVGLATTHPARPQPVEVVSPAGASVATSTTVAVTTTTAAPVTTTTVPITTTVQTTTVTVTPTTLASATTTIPATSTTIVVREPPTTIQNACTLSGATDCGPAPTLPAGETAPSEPTTTLQPTG